MTVNAALDADGYPASSDASPVVFAPGADAASLVAMDLVERHRYEVATGGGDLESVDPDRLRAPVDTAVRLHTDHVAVPDAPALFVRDADWRMLATTDPPFERRFPAGEYSIEICAPVKLYVRASGPLTVRASVDGKRVSFDEERSVVVGARSKHDHPAGTVTTTADPRDVMAAVSTFGSALKTTSPERSFPTLRGHPPAVERGAELAIPDGIAHPDTGVTIEVPPDLRYVFPAATLAYYLGAEVRPGDDPRVVTDDGFTHDLAPDGDFEGEVERVLKAAFLLDCLVRTEGLYQVDLHERRRLEPALDLDLATLYEQPLGTRLAAYLEVPYEVLEPVVPAWQLTADVAPEADAVETLPFLVGDLAVVRTASSDGPAVTTGPRNEEWRRQRDAVDTFLRADGAGVTPPPRTVSLPETDSLEHAWVGDGVPQRASKVSATAYRNRLERTPVEGDISVTVVCNDRAMLDERDVVDATYGTGLTGVDVAVREHLTRDELRATLAGDAEFLHYVGHIDDRGVRCADGWLDASTISTTEVGAFLLNACTSYDQGMALVEAGAVGGVVTRREVPNEAAVRVGSTVARLLNNGYPLRPALEIAREASYSAGEYVVVGDGSVAVAHSQTPHLHLHRVERAGSRFDLEIVSYANVTGGMGTMFVPYIEGADRYHLNSGSIGTFRVSEDELRRFLSLDDIPIEACGDLYWPEGFDPSRV